MVSFCLDQRVSGRRARPNDPFGRPLGWQIRDRLSQQLHCCTGLQYLYKCSMSEFHIVSKCSNFVKVMQMRFWLISILQCEDKRQPAVYLYFSVGHALSFSHIKGLGSLLYRAIFLYKIAFYGSAYAFFMCMWTVKQTLTNANGFALPLKGTVCSLMTR